MSVFNTGFTGGETFSPYGHLMNEGVIDKCNISEWKCFSKRQTDVSKFRVPGNPRGSAGVEGECRASEG